MRNYLKHEEIPVDYISACYEVGGELDSIAASVFANKFRLVLGFGPASVSLSLEAATELSEHMQRAVAAMKRAEYQR